MSADLRNLLPRLVVMARNVAADRTVQVNLGVASMYDRGRHCITFAPENLAWGDAEALGLAAHEGAHVQLSHYFDQLPAASLEDSLHCHAANLFEDIRVNAWAAHHFCGLAEGLRALSDRVEAECRASVAAVDAVPRALRACRALRLRALGLPAPDEADAAVRAAVAAGAGPLTHAVDVWPRDWDASLDERVACSQAFCTILVRDVLPELNRLRALDQAACRSQAARRRLQEQEQRAADPFRAEQAVWRPWQRTQGREPEGERADVATSAAYRRRLVDIGPLLAEFTHQLERHLLPNANASAVGRYLSGPRLDILAAMRFDAGVGTGRVFQRRTEPRVQRYRVVILADVSESMSGPPLDAVAATAVLLLEAGERIGVETGLVLFGTRTEGGVLVLKEPGEPLIRRRSAINAAFTDAQLLGKETPLAEALRAAALVLGGVGEGQDLVLVVTDGCPRTTQSTFFDQPRKLTTSDERGSAGGMVTVQGRTSTWRSEVEEERRVAAALRAVAVPGRLVVGVGIGAEAQVDRHFEHHRRFANHRAFAAAFPALLEDWLAVASSRRR